MGWEYLFKMFSVSLGSNQNRVHDSYAGNTKKITCCLSIQFSNNIAIMSWQIIGFPVTMEFLIYVAKITIGIFKRQGTVGKEIIVLSSTARFNQEDK